MGMLGIDDYYARGNGNAKVVSVGELDIYFSYKTPVAFRTPETRLVCSKNEWSNTTGRHLNSIEPDHTKRVDHKKMMGLLVDHLTDIGLW